MQFHVLILDGVFVEDIYLHEILTFRYEIKTLNNLIETFIESANFTSEVQIHTKKESC